MKDEILQDAPLVEIDDFKQWILYESNDLLVLNKPGWLVCHPSKNGPLSSLVGTAKLYLGKESIHLASRLDRETSGVILMAKHRKAASCWQKGIEYKTVKRGYLAIMRGELVGEQLVEGYIGNDSASAVFVKQCVTGKSRKSKYSETMFTPLIAGEKHTLCLVRTNTGRKHQIRVHAQSLGHSLVGDKLYGGNEHLYLEFCSNGWKEEWRSMLELNRQALHGRWLVNTETTESFVAPLPMDITNFYNEHFGNKGKGIRSVLKQADELFYQGITKN
ncbi:RluA family pseudouridine synthase [Opitutales bacterium]|jgi:23S rRNA pseudouridine1911/1915/1917 synthase|nr:RluA family pseudouridine synthase [Opitutales bacterium]